MDLFYIIGFIFAFYISICFRVAVTHPIKTIRYAITDFIKWVRYKRWNECKTGQLVAYVGLFGKGKTLSAVHHVVSRYNKYNDKKVFDFHRKKWVTQKVHIVSNVELALPYEKFTGLAQIVQISERYKKYDEENDTLTCHLILGDEFSVQMNSRSFKSNIDPLFLNTLLTCRHHHISLIYTAQRFNHVDALLRQVTSWVISCNKVWRFMVHGQFDAFALENATDPTLVKSTKRFGWFITDADYNAYDTLACVENLKKSCEDGDMLTEEEILALQQNNGVNMEAVAKPSRQYVKMRKKMTK